jgi:hypothetical protein
MENAHYQGRKRDMTNDFKPVKDYTCEELLQSCQSFFGGQFWLWYESVADVAGEETAQEVLLKLADNFGALEADFVKSLWGKAFKNLQELADCFDVIHEMVGYGCSWTMDDEKNGFERVEDCPVHNATPEKYQGKGICKSYCKRIGQVAYSRLNAEISREKFLPDGDPYCGCRIKWKS